MAQAPSQAQQAAMLMKMLQQAEAKQNDAPKGPTWSVVTEILNVDSKASTINADTFSKIATGSITPLSDRFVTNQVDEGADLLFKLQFSEKIKIEEITFYCKPHSPPNNNDNNDNNDNNENNENGNDDNGNNNSNENKDNGDNENENENKDSQDSKPVCPTRLYFAKNAETLSNYFENTIISRDDSFEDNELTLIKLDSNELIKGSGFRISFLKQRPKVFKGTGLRTNTLIFGISHEANQLDEDDDDDTDVDMDGDEKYKEKSIYLSGIFIKAAGQVAS